MSVNYGGFLSRDRWKTKSECSDSINNITRLTNYCVAEGVFLLPACLLLSI